MKQITPLTSQQIMAALFSVLIATALFALTSDRTLGQSINNNLNQNSYYKGQLENGSPTSSRLKPETSPSGASPTGATSLPEIKLTAEESQLVSLINQERSHTGLEKLEVNSFLVNLAREKSWDMVRHNYFGHKSERLGTVYDQFKRSGITSQSLDNLMIAENLAGAPECYKAYRQMLASPTHRSNILNSHFTKMGIGVAKGGPFGMMITELFVN